MITKIKPISCRIVNGATPLSMLPGLMYLKLEKSEKLQTIEKFGFVEAQPQRIPIFSVEISGVFPAIKSAVIRAVPHDIVQPRCPCPVL